MKDKKTLYYVTFQIFGKKGTLLTNQYLELNAPFFPEHAKLEYMRQNPDVAMKREYIVIINWWDVEDRRESYEWQLKKDQQLSNKRKAIQEEAAAGGYGQGDEAVQKVRELMNYITQEELNEEDIPPTV